MSNSKLIGTRRELFVDDFLIHTTNARFVLQKPTAKEICFQFDAPYDGSYNGYATLIKDGDLYRLYYRAGDLVNSEGTKFFEMEQKVYHCCIESQDGVNWYRPSLGLVEYNGNKENNILFNEPSDNGAFIPFLDTNPDCSPDERYKALDYEYNRNNKVSKLAAYKSADGYKWSKMFSETLSMDGKFDSSNLAFWDPIARTYWAYIRNFHTVFENSPEIDLNNKVRDIRWSQSMDFKNWSEPERLNYNGNSDIPLYVSAVQPYYRAPHLFLGFPARYVERHNWSPSYDQLSDPTFRKNIMKHHPRYGLALTDCVFMSSRDGKTWNRSDEAFLRPGLIHNDNWLYGDCFLAIGMEETKSDLQGAANDISIYYIEHPWHKQRELRRYTIRPDGFVALSADSKGCMTVTKPFIFDGKKLTLNVSTSVVGGMRLEFQDPSGRVIEGYSLDDCDEIFGDRLDYVVSWNGSSDVSGLAGKEVHMRFYMEDVDLFSFKFEL